MRALILSAIICDAGWGSYVRTAAHILSFTSNCTYCCLCRYYKQQQGCHTFTTRQTSSTNRLDVSVVLFQLLSARVYILLFITLCAIIDRSLVMRDLILSTITCDAGWGSYERTAAHVIYLTSNCIYFYLIITVNTVKHVKDIATPVNVNLRQWTG